jgi:hypothetical protein
MALPLVPVHPLVTQAPRADGLKVTLSAIGNGLTVDKQGRPLLPQPFVFQCPPLEQFQVTHAQNFGTYDTIDDDQFIRRGARSLDTWTFDTLVMYLGVDAVGHHAPSWVPYPTREPHSAQFYSPEWYRGQLKDLHDAGSPFLFEAAFHRSSMARRSFAVLTGFSEVHKHGEGDTIYFTGVAFSEWRDPGDASKKRGHTKLPAHVRFRITGGHYIAYEANTGHTVPTRKGGTTLADLARWFYGDGTRWRLIASANHLKGGDGNASIFSHWYPHRLAHGKPNVTMVVPQQPPKHSSPRTAPAKGKTKAKH